MGPETQKSSKPSDKPDERAARMEGSNSRIHPLIPPAQERVKYIFARRRPEYHLSSESEFECIRGSLKRIRKRFPKEDELRGFQVDPFKIHPSVSSCMCPADRIPVKVLIWAQRPVCAVPPSTLHKHCVAKPNRHRSSHSFFTVVDDRGTYKSPAPEILPDRFQCFK